MINTLIVMLFIIILACGFLYWKYLQAKKKVIGVATEAVKIVTKQVSSTSVAQALLQKRSKKRKF